MKLYSKNKTCTKSTRLKILLEWSVTSDREQPVLNEGLKAILDLTEAKRVLEVSFAFCDCTSIFGISQTYG